MHSLVYSLCVTIMLCLYSILFVSDSLINKIQLLRQQRLLEPSTKRKKSNKRVIHMFAQSTLNSLIIDLNKI